MFGAGGRDRRDVAEVSHEIGAVALEARAVTGEPRAVTPERSAITRKICAVAPKAGVVAGHIWVGAEDGFVIFIPVEEVPRPVGIVSLALATSEGLGESVDVGHG